jgi:hypothetical protein
LDFSNAGSGRGGGVDLGHGDDFDEGVRDAVEVEQLSRGRVFLRLGSVLFELDLFDADADLVSIFRRNPIVAEQIYVAVSRKRLCRVVNRQ